METSEIDYIAHTLGSAGRSLEKLTVARLRDVKPHPAIQYAISNNE